MASATARRRLGVLAAAWEICKKDARIELRTREVLATAGVFSIVVGVLASMTFFVHPKYNRATAAGTIWIAVFFASVLSFSRIWQRERDESALTALLVSPVARASIFLGKAFATFVTILLVEIPLVALAHHRRLPLRRARFAWRRLARAPAGAVRTGPRLGGGVAR